jgi:coatomer protein complex subunit alpha (xenin)
MGIMSLHQRLARLFPLPAANSHPLPPPHTHTHTHTRTQLAVEHAAAGSFSSAMSLLHRQLGVANFEPLRPYFLDLYTASHAWVPGIPGAPSTLTHLDR